MVNRCEVQHPQPFMKKIFKGILGQPDAQLGQGGSSGTLTVIHVLDHLPKLMRS